MILFPEILIQLVGPHKGNTLPVCIFWVEYNLSSACYLYRYYLIRLHVVQIGIVI